MKNPPNDLRKLESCTVWSQAFSSLGLCNQLRKRKERKEGKRTQTQENITNLKERRIHNFNIQFNHAC